MSIEIKQVEQEYPFLGRQMVHDSRSRLFTPKGLAVDKTTWRTKSIRLYDPLPNPNQRVGNCTGVAKAMQLNAAGNRNPVRHRSWWPSTSGIITMLDAEQIYHLNTQVDPWPGEWPPDDTGSSGLASAQSAQAIGWGGEYNWLFGGADEVVQEVMRGNTVSVGTWWYQGMMNQDADGVIHPTGPRVGGHQYLIRGYVKAKDLVLGRCWWGDFRDFYIPRSALNDLIMDDGDAHTQRTL